MAYAWQPSPADRGSSAGKAPVRRRREFQQALRALAERPFTAPSLEPVPAVSSSSCASSRGLCSSPLPRHPQQERRQQRPPRSPRAPALASILSPPPGGATPAACESVALQVAVLAWWRGAPGRRQPTDSAAQQKEAAWLHAAAAGGIAAGAATKLERSGIPVRVVRAGLHLSKTLEEEPEIAEMWRNSPSEASFVKNLVSDLLQRFDIRVPLWHEQDPARPALIMTARSRRAASPNQARLLPAAPSRQSPRSTPVARPARPHSSQQGCIRSPRQLHPHHQPRPGTSMGISGLRDMMTPSPVPSSPAADHLLLPEVPPVQLAKPVDTSFTPPHPVSEQTNETVESDVPPEEEHPPSVSPEDAPERPEIEQQETHRSESPKPDEKKEEEEEVVAEEALAPDDAATQQPQPAEPPRPPQLEDAEPQRQSTPEPGPEAHQHPMQPHMSIDLDVTIPTGQWERLQTAPEASTQPKGTDVSISVPLAKWGRMVSEPQAGEADSQQEENAFERSRTECFRDQASTPSSGRRSSLRKGNPRSGVRARRASFSQPEPPPAIQEGEAVDAEKNPLKPLAQKLHANLPVALQRRHSFAVVASGRQSPHSMTPVASQMSRHSSRRSSTGGKHTPLSSSNFDKWLRSHKDEEEKKKQRDAEELAERMAKQKEDEAECLLNDNGIPRRCSVAHQAVRNIEEVKRLFDEFDADASGSLDRREFLPLLSKLMHQPISEMNMQQVWKHYEKMDENGDGHISFDEFSAWYCTVFHFHADDHTTFFSSDLIPAEEREVREVMKTLDIDFLAADKIWKEFKRLDKDNTGTVEFEEFKELLRHRLVEDTGVNKPPKSPQSGRKDLKRRMTYTTAELQPWEEVQVAPKLLEKLWHDIDADQNGAITFMEFAAWYTKLFHGSRTPMEQFYQAMTLGWRADARQA